MKKNYLLFFIAVISFYACTEKNNPDPQIPWNETGYRLDSALSYSENVLSGKSVYYYSISSEYCDSTYHYILENNQWRLSTRYTYKYDENWNRIEEIFSDWENNKLCFRWKWTYKYDEERNLIEKKRSDYNNKWIQREYYYNDMNHFITIVYDDMGEEQSRSEYTYEYDSFGNITLSIVESYFRGSFLSYRAEKHDYYYTEKRVDSVYNYVKAGSQSPYQCTGKTLYMDYDSNNNCIESVYYWYSNNQFVLNRKTTSKYDSNSNCVGQISYMYVNNQFVQNDMIERRYDSRGNMTLFQNKHYEWKNNELKTRWILEETNQYIPDTDLLQEYSHVATDYYESGEVVHVNNKSVYYYTKL